MLRWWKQKVTVSYSDWVKAKYKLEDLNVDGSWVASSLGSDEDARMGILYRWTLEGELGYKRRWKHWFLATSQDYTREATQSVGQLGVRGGVGTLARARSTGVGQSSIKT
jgi:hypothetical protein